MLLESEGADLSDLCYVVEGDDGFLVFDNRSTGGKVLSCDLELPLLFLYVIWSMLFLSFPSFFIVTFLFIVNFPKFVWRGVLRG